MGTNVVRNTKHYWHLLNAEQQRVGRLASYCVTILQGKHKPTFTPHIDCGDNIVIVNVDKLIFTGNKYNNKLYRWHTGYPGGLKQTTPRRLVEDKKRPEEILQRAVKGMLPNNKLRDQRLSRLKIFSGPEIDKLKLSRMKVDYEVRHRRKTDPEDCRLPPLDENGEFIFHYVQQPPKRYDIRQYFK